MVVLILNRESVVTSPVSTDLPSLRSRWLERRASHGPAWLRDEALALGVSEAELLLASREGEVTRLRNEDVPALMADIASWGEVRTMTRNESAVIEATGRYEGLAFGPHAGQTVGDLELRIFPSRWAHILAVEVRHGEHHRGSVQVFDRAGHSVHKVFTEDLHAWRATRDRWMLPPDAPALTCEPRSGPLDRPDADIDVATLQERWDALRDTHEFHGLLRELGVGRLQALRLAGASRARLVTPGALEAVLAGARDGHQRIMIFVGSQGVVQIHVGTVGHLKRSPGWLNILDRGFNLHVREADIASAWVVTKPTVDGPVHSLECYDAAGNTIVQLFAKRAEGEPTPESWIALLATLESVA